MTECLMFHACLMFHGAWIKAPRSWLKGQPAGPRGPLEALELATQSSRRNRIGARIAARDHSVLLGVRRSPSSLVGNRKLRGLRRASNSRPQQLCMGSHYSILNLRRNPWGLGFSNALHLPMFATSSPLAN